MASHTPDDARLEDLRRRFEEAVEEVGNVAVAHLRIQYPAALAAIPKTAQIALRNAVKAAARTRFAQFVSLGPKSFTSVGNADGT